MTVLTRGGFIDGHDCFIFVAIRSYPCTECDERSLDFSFKDRPNRWQGLAGISRSTDETTRGRRNTAKL